MTERPAWIAKELNALTWDVLRPVVFAGVGVGLILLATCNMAQSAPITCDQRGCSDWKMGSVKPTPSRHTRRSIDANGNAVVIGGRPAGCPHAYCGCGLARYLGLKDRRLNLAWSWAKMFPRTSAAPGMAAVRRGHVMLLQSHVEGTRWIVRDYNGGRHLSWIHERDVRGYVFVNPHGSYAER
jgi:hypothetical protein